MMNEHGVCFVDNTLLMAMACETKALLRHHHGLTGRTESARLKAGSAGHEALADWLRGADVKTCMETLDREYGLWAEENIDLDDPLCYTNVATILKFWLEDHPLQQWPLIVKPEHVEIGFQVPLVDECVCGYKEGQHNPYSSRCPEYRPAFIFYGRLDALGTRRSDGRLFVIDHKLTGRCDDKFMDKFRLESQMSGYVWAARQTGFDAAGAYVNGIEALWWLAGLRTPQKKCYKHSVPYEDCMTLHVKQQLQPFDRGPEALEGWHRTAVALARRYRELCRRLPAMEDLHDALQEGMFWRECQWCEFKDFCESQRPLQYAHSVLRHEPWAPFEQEGEAND